MARRLSPKSHERPKACTQSGHRRGRFRDGTDNDHECDPAYTGAPKGGKERTEYAQASMATQRLWRLQTDGEEMHVRPDGEYANQGRCA